MGNNQPGGAAPSEFNFGQGGEYAYQGTTRSIAQPVQPQAAIAAQIITSQQDHSSRISILNELSSQMHDLEAKRRDILERVAAKKKALHEEHERCGQRVIDVENEIESQYNEAVVDIRAKYEEDLRNFTVRHRSSLEGDVAELTDVTFEERKVFVKEDANSYFTFWLEDQWDKKLESLEKQWESSLMYTLRVSKEEHEKAHRQALAKYEGEIAELERQVEEEKTRKGGFFSWFTGSKRPNREEDHDNNDDDLDNDNFGEKPAAKRMR